MNSLALENRILKWGYWLIGLAFLGQAFLSRDLAHWVHPETVEASHSLRLDKKVASTLRASAFLTGNRVLVGHAFWIKVIQYYGDSYNSLDRYSKLYDYCSLASDLNPKFIGTYTLGASALAFHLKRMNEAERLLQKGINSNPGDTRLKLMYASIAYQNIGDFNKVIPFLEAQIERGDAPYMMINILANTYQKAGRNADAVKIWQKIIRDSDEQEQKILAGQKLQELYAIIKNKTSGLNPKVRQRAVED